MSNNSARWAFNFTKWSPTYNDLLQSTACIQQEEKQRIGRFVFKKDFKSSLIGRLMMRKFVANSTNIPYNEVNIKRDEKGKPFVENCNVTFNVSHQGDFTVFAGDFNDGILGIDVMKLEYKGGKSLKEFFRIMTRQFSQYEWSEIFNAGNEKQQLAMFCRHWCLKESYVKATGVGITINLQEISFKINTKQLNTDNIVDDTELYIKGEKIRGGNFMKCF